MAKLSECAVVVTRLAAVHGQAVNTEQVKAFYLVLERYPRMVLVEALYRALQEIKFMPKPSELFAIANEANTRYRLAPESRFDEAGQWIMFRRGYQSTDELTDADIAEVYREMLPGAPAWCVMPLAEVMA